MSTPRSMSWLRSSVAAALLAVADAGCSTTPSPADLQRADLGAPPPQATCEAAAARYLTQSGANPTQIVFAPLERGWFRLGTLGMTRFAWHLAATVDVASAPPGPRTTKACSFWFAGGELVAVGAMQPCRNRTTVSEQWIVTTIEPDGRPTSGRYLDLASARPPR